MDVQVLCPRCNCYGWLIKYYKHINGKLYGPYYEISHKNGKRRTCSLSKKYKDAIEKLKTQPVDASDPNEN